MNRTDYSKTIRHITLKTRDSAGKLHTYRRATKARILRNLQACSGKEFRIKVVYPLGYSNETTWYTSRKELRRALDAFCEAGLLREFL